MSIKLAKIDDTINGKGGGGLRDGKRKPAFRGDPRSVSVPQDPRLCPFSQSQPVDHGTATVLETAEPRTGCSNILTA